MYAVHVSDEIGGKENRKYSATVPGRDTLCSFRIPSSILPVLHYSHLFLSFPLLSANHFLWPLLSASTASIQGKAAGAGGSEGGGTDPAAVAAVRFCLSLFSACLKRNRMDPTDRVVLSMAAPFVPLLGQCLRLSGAVDVVTIATRCLCTLLTWGIQVEPKFVQAVGELLHIAVPAFYCHEDFCSAYHLLFSVVDIECATSFPPLTLVQLSLSPSLHSSFPYSFFLSHHCTIPN